MEYSKLASGKVTGITGGIIPVILPFLPNIVEIYNFTASTTPANTKVAHTWWSSAMAQGSAIQSVFNATPVATTQTTLTGGISTFTAGAAGQYGTIFTISSITQASPAVVTTSAPHGYVTGDVVLIYATTGMLQVGGVHYKVTVTGATTFTIDVDASAFAAAATAGFAKKVLYPYLYFPGENIITALTRGVTTTVTTAANHNYVVGQQVAFHIQPAFGTSEISEGRGLYNPLSGFVTSITSATIFVCNVDSSAATAFAYPTSAVYAAGVSPARVVAIGDNNLGPLLAGTLFPPPTTINALTIAGAFQNNTRQGFIIGNTSSGTTEDVLYWTAYGMDYPSAG